MFTVVEEDSRPDWTGVWGSIDQTRIECAQNPHQFEQIDNTSLTIQLVVWGRILQLVCSGFWFGTVILINWGMFCCNLPPNTWISPPKFSNLTDAYKQTCLSVIHHLCLVSFQSEPTTFEFGWFTVLSVSHECLSQSHFPLCNGNPKPRQSTPKYPNTVVKSFLACVH